MENIKKENGKGLCIIIDGLDEYEFNCPNDLIIELIKKETLPLAMVIVSSRPVGTATIRDYPQVTLRVEILGFKNDEIKKYIYNYFECDIDLSCKLIAYLEQHVNVYRMCYLPVHAQMICRLYKKLGENIPHNETEIYESFTRLTLLRKLKDNSRIKLEDLDNLPDSVNEYFGNICQLALDMIVQSKQIIRQSQTDFPLSPPGSEKSSLGLVTIDSTAELFGIEDLYAFHHLTFQEYLAAVHLKNKEEEEVVKITMISKSKLHMVWKFYFGMVTFKPNSLVLKHVMLDTTLDNLLKIQCAFESQQEIVCDSIEELNKTNSLSFNSNNLVQVDFLAMSYVLSITQHQLTKLSFQNCSLEKEGIVLFIEKLCSNHLHNIKHLVYHYKNCNLSQLSVLNILLQKLTSLVVLDLENINMGVEGIKILTDEVELKDLATLKIKMPLKKGKVISNDVLIHLRFNKSKDDLLLQYTCSGSINYFDTCMYLTQLNQVFDYCFSTNYKILVCFNTKTLQLFRSERTHFNTIGFLLHHNNSNLVKAWGLHMCSKVIFVNCGITTKDLLILEPIDKCTEIYTVDFNLKMVTSKVASKICNSINEFVILKSSDFNREFKRYRNCIMAKIIEEIGRLKASSISSNCIFNSGLGSIIRIFHNSDIKLELCGTNSLNIMDVEHLTDIMCEISNINSGSGVEVLLYKSGVNQLHTIFHIFLKYLKVDKLCDAEELYNVKTLYFNWTSSYHLSVLNNILKHCAKLKSLNIKINIFNKECAVIIAEGLKCCTNLQKLDLSNNFISSNFAILADRLMHCSNLLELDVSSSNVGSSVLALAHNGLHNLQELNLTGNNRNSVDTRALSYRPANSSLEVLNLGDNCIGFDGAITVVNRFKKCYANLKILDFTNNKIGSDDAVALVHLHCDFASLQTLDLSGNSIGLHGVWALAERLKSCINLQEINLSQIGIDLEKAEAYATGLKCCANLHVLDVSNNEIDSGGIAALVDGLESCVYLHTLDISWNEIDSKGAIAISSKLRKLKALILHGNRIGFDGVIAIADRLKDLTSPIDYKNFLVSAGAVNLLKVGNFSSLQTLDLSGNSIGLHGAWGLAVRLKSCIYLQEINLSQIGIGLKKAEAYATGLKFCANLRILDVSKNEINSGGIAALVDGLESCVYLHTLDISCNIIDSKGAIAISSKLMKLKTLILHSNRIGFDGAMAIVNRLKDLTSPIDYKHFFVSYNCINMLKESSCSTVLALDLSRIGIDLFSVELVKKLQSYTNLQSLNLSMNYIDTDGITFFADGLKFCSKLYTLNLSNNKIDSSGVVALASGFKYFTNLISLNLGSNNIGSEGAIALASRLKHCANLISLNFKSNNIDSEGAIALANELQGCIKLRTLSLEGNLIGFDGAITLVDRLRNCNISLHTLDFCKERFDIYTSIGALLIHII